MVYPMMCGGSTALSNIRCPAEKVILFPILFLDLSTLEIVDVYVLYKFQKSVLLPPLAPVSPLLKQLFLLYLLPDFLCIFPDTFYASTNT